MKREVVGVVPAAGRATRISPLPCSKEIYPVTLGVDADKRAARPKCACVYLLERMRVAGIGKAFVVLRDGKWDIPAYLGGGDRLGIELAYLIAELPFGAPYTVSRALPFARDATIAFGFPDMIFRSEDIFTRLLARAADRPVDVLLGLFPAETGRRVDVVEVGEGGRVRRMLLQHDVIGPAAGTWGIAVWAPSFSEFIAGYVRDRVPTAAAAPEATMGEVIKQAALAGLRVDAVPVCDTPYLDIGTPEGLLAAYRRTAERI